MSRCVSRIVALAVLVAAAGTGTAGAQTMPPSLGGLVDQVLALFPKVDGEVIEVLDGTITLALGSRDGLISGVQLALYRQGRELRHPKTGEILGRTEQAVGRVVIRQVFESYSTGTAGQGSEVQPGDRARVSAGKIKLRPVPIVEGGGKGGVGGAAGHEGIEALNPTGRLHIGPRGAIRVCGAPQ